MEDRLMKTVQHKDGILHIETDYCIVNVHAGLTNRKGQGVTAIEILPDNYAGEQKCIVRGSRNVRVIQCKHAKN